MHYLTDKEIAHEKYMLAEYFESLRTILKRKPTQKEVNRLCAITNAIVRVPWYHSEVLDWK